MAEHVLKTWPSHWEAVARGDKRFELRRNDREFCVGDTLLLREWSPTTEEYSGRTRIVRVTHLLTGGHFGLAEGHVVMSIELGGA